MPNDIIVFLIEYVNRIRRSPWLGLILGPPILLEEDVKNCEVGWPGYRDPAFNCSVTIIATIPFYYGLKEECIVKQESTSFILCEEFDGFVPALQGWVRYCNAVLNPFLSCPFVVPTFILTVNPTILGSVSWAFWKVNGSIPERYTVYDLPNFSEPCLFLKLIILALGFALLIGIIVLIIVACIFCWPSYSKYTMKKRLYTLERKGFDKSKDEIKKLIKEERRV